MKQRKAVKLPDQIVADCPIGSTCTCLVEGTKDWTTCGYYQGCTQTRKGCWAVCSYDEQGGA